MWLLRDVKARSTVLLCLACVVEGAEMALLPALYLPLARSLSASPSELGVMTLWRAMAQAIASPLRSASRTLAVAAHTHTSRERLRSRSAVACSICHSCTAATVYAPLRVAAAGRISSAAAS